MQTWGKMSLTTVNRFLFRDTAYAAVMRKIWSESKLGNTGKLMSRLLRENTPNFYSQAAFIKCPTLLLSGIYDRNGGLITAISLHQLLSRSQLELFHKTGHFRDMEEEELFASKVIKFLNGNN